MTRIRKNVPERMLEQLATRAGWRATKRGWPDFLCVNDLTGESIAVEVKARRKDGLMDALKREQVACMEVLTAHGIRCFVSDGTTLEPYTRKTHGMEPKRQSGKGGNGNRPRKKPVVTP